ncbi:MAG: C-terminal helicase domain-containing protein, partial [Bradymonadaceae bacterium]
PTEGQFGTRPSVQLEMLTYEPTDPEAWMWANLESRLRDLSFEACAPRWPRGLFVEYTLRRWESGPEALAETLERLVEYHRRWLEARRHGRTLDRAEFRELFAGPGEFRQEVFPFLFPDGETDESTEGETGPVRRDLEVLESLADRVRALREVQRGPRSAIIDLASETDDKLLIFTRYQRAAGGIYRALVDAFGGRGRVAVATGHRGRATGLGRCSLDEILRRFAPASYAGEEIARHQQIRVLVATDCLSEGVNLQDCGRVVLADLPDSALVVEQRIGRFVRPGSPHETVRVYLPRPTNWRDTLGLRRRLQRKLSQAEMSGAEMTAAGSVFGREAGDRAAIAAGDTGTQPTGLTAASGGDGTGRPRRRMGP